MPRKRRASTPTLEADEEEFVSEEKYSKDDLDSRAPRNAANARERARMRVLSKAFCRLKTTLPWVPADTKLSKLDTLRLAATYIAHLRAVLRDDGDAHSETTRSLSFGVVSRLRVRKITENPGGSSRRHNASSSQTRSLFTSLQSWPFALQGGNASMLMNNSCNVSSSTSSSSNQYRGQQGNHEIQNFHHSGHQSMSLRHNHEPQLSYF